MLQRPWTGTLMSVLTGWLSAVAAAQSGNPVYVDDSPQAWELFRQAQDQARNNPSEAVRVYQELLDDFPVKLVPTSETGGDHFMAVRLRVLAAIRADATLLERYRTIQTPQAARMLEAGQVESLAASRSLTEPGLDAMLALAQRHLEAGRFHTARTVLREAADHPDIAGRAEGLGAENRAAGGRATSRLAHLQYMTALANWALAARGSAGADGDVQREALESLVALGAEGEAFVQQLQALAAQPRPALVRGVSSLDHGRAADLTDMVAQAIWSVPLDQTILRRRNAVLPGGAQGDDAQPPPVISTIESRTQELDLTTVTPTIAGQVVYVNQGFSISAIHRITGQVLWTYSLVGRAAQIEPQTTEAFDLNVVAADGQSVVTITGHAQTAGRSEPARIVCLEAATGALRWSVSLAGIVESTAGEELFAHGAPVLAEGLVIVATRKLLPQMLTSSYVVALDAASGSVRWARYITSSGGLRAAPRPFGSIAYDDGSVYVASAVGSIARLEAATGEVRWLQRFAVPITPQGSDYGRRPWEIGGPVLTDRGVLAIQPDQRRIVVLDRDTGHVLESHSATDSNWSMPRYLLASGGANSMVFGVGAEIRAFHIDDLSQPIWRFPAAATSSFQPFDPAAGGAATDSPRDADGPASPTLRGGTLDIRGRAHLVDDALVVPTARGLLVLNAETGRIMQQLAIQPSGNPVAVDAQLVVASGERVDAFMSFGRAERMLRDRIVASPNDPEPPLSLLRLAMRVRNLALALESADLVMQSISRLGAADPQDPRPAGAREQLFTLLLEMASQGQTGARDLTIDEAESLFATCGAVALTDEQRVEHLLTYGQWLEPHAIARSVSTYQTILSTPQLARTWRGSEGVMRPAGAWATQRLAALIQQRGASVYAPQEDLARSQLRQLAGVPAPREGRGAEGRSGSVSPDALVALAQKFPLADAAIDAVVQAAGLYQQRGDRRAALGALSAFYHAAPTARSAARVLGEFAAICQATEAIDLARGSLRQVLAAHGNLRMLPAAAAAPPRDAAAWLEALDAIPGSGPGAAPPPRLGDVEGEAQVLAGVIIAPADAAVALPADRALLRQPGKAVLIGAQDLAQAWAANIDAIPPVLLRSDGRGIVLWHPFSDLPVAAPPGGAKAVALEPSDGSLRWATPRLEEVLGGPAAGGAAVEARIRGLREAMPNGEQFDPNQVLPLLLEDQLVMVQRTGAAAAFELPSAQPTELAEAQPAPSTRWVRKATLNQVHFAHLHEAALALAGMAGATVREDSRTGAPREAPGAPLSPRLLLLDPATGQPLTEPIAPVGRSGVKWMRASRMGILAYGTAEGLGAIDLHSGQRLWANASYAALDTQRAWCFGDTLVIEDQRNRLRLVDLDDGSISEPFELPTRTEWEQTQAIDVVAIVQPVQDAPQQVEATGAPSAPGPGAASAAGQTALAAPRSPIRLAVLYQQRVLMYDLPAGGGLRMGTPALAGADSITDEREYRWIIVARDRIVVVSGRSEQAQALDIAGRRLQYRYKLYVLSHNGRVLAAPVELPPLAERLQGAAAIDGWLLLSTANNTLAAPMPAK